MLEGAFTSPKIRRLAAVLEIPWPQALGLAALLWRFTAKHAATGEIGRHDDEEIAAALEWPGDAGPLVAAFVRCRLLDPAPLPARLLTHDWPDHAPRYVGFGLKRRGEAFSDLYSDASGLLAIASGERTTSTSSSSSTCTSASSKYTRPPDEREREDEQPARPVAETDERLVAIWTLWVAGRKTGKAKAIASMRSSLRRLAAAGLTREEALDRIEEGTRRDAEQYRQDLAHRRIELKYVPLGSTYFSQERWLDDEDRPEDHERNRTDDLLQDLDRLRDG